jgi:hypothetical protein
MRSGSHVNIGVAMFVAGDNNHRHRTMRILHKRAAGCAIKKNLISSLWLFKLRERSASRK